MDDKNLFLKKLQSQKIEMVVIGVSAGGVNALMQFLPAFKDSPLSVAIVIHLPPKSENLIPTLLAPLCNYEVSEALAGEEILKKHIYIAPTNYHLCIEPNFTLSFSSEEPVNYSRPSIDILFDSAAYAYSNKLLGILLTGANEDGALGLLKIKEMGGLTVVQDPASAEYGTMPQSALDLFKPDLVVNLEELSQLISRATDHSRNYEKV